MPRKDEKAQPLRHNDLVGFIRLIGSTKPTYDDDTTRKYAKYYINEEIACLRSNALARKQATYFPADLFDSMESYQQLANNKQPLKLDVSVAYRVVRWREYVDSHAKLHILGKDKEHLPTPENFKWSPGTMMQNYGKFDERESYSF